ncbi:MAG TPA: alpha/beta fold hydrolase [Luteibacter sp.]|jgi:pimeloyl-ACP methyl ester carboxylesterase|nr:alpha/beta fold hydrolase [Luteibacter sp.]
MFIEAHGIRHHVILADVHGERAFPDPERPLVVMVHGALIDTFASFYLSLHWPLALLGMTSFMYDRRGHGRTPYVRRTLTLQQASTDIAGMLDAVGVTTPVHLIGNSLGACVAVDFAVHFPSRAASLVLMEGEPPTRAWRSAMLDGLACGLDDTDPNRPDIFGDGSKRTRHQRRAQVAMKLLDETTIFRDIGASRTVDGAMLQALTLPILGIYGERSLVGAQSRTLETLGDKPNVDIQILAGAGHLLLFDAATEVSHRIEAFYRRHEPRCAPRIAAS